MVVGTGLASPVCMYMKLPRAMSVRRDLEFISLRRKTKKNATPKRMLTPKETGKSRRVSSVRYAPFFSL